MKFLVYLFLFWGGASFASSCESHIRALQSFVGRGEFAIAVDYDGTMADTDAFILRNVLPKAVAKLLGTMPVDKHTPFRLFLEYLEVTRDAVMPESYEESHWSHPEWPFPVSELPEALSQRPFMRPGSSALDGFWNLMSEVFQDEPRHGIPLLPGFLSFFNEANRTFGPEVHWVVVTARHEEMADDLAPTIASLRGHANPIEVITRGPKAPLYGDETGVRKGRQIEQIRTPGGGVVRAFLDNEPRNLVSVQERMGERLMYFRVQRPGPRLPPVVVSWP